MQSYYETLIIIVMLLHKEISPLISKSINIVSEILL